MADVAAAIGAETASLLAYAWLQQRVLRLAGTRTRLPGLFLLTLANDAISCTVPGEPAVSSGYRFRYYRRCGQAPRARAGRCSRFSSRRPSACPSCCWPAC